MGYVTNMSYQRKTKISWRKYVCSLRSYVAILLPGKLQTVPRSIQEEWKPQLYLDGSLRSRKYMGWEL